MIHDNNNYHNTTTVLTASVSIRKALRDIRPVTPDQLHGYCRLVLGFNIPRKQYPRYYNHNPDNATLIDTCMPFDYLCHSFFETGIIRDCVVWANRGGGKTQLGAIATVLDLIFKPGIQIRVLGGSKDQSSKMYRYIRDIMERDEMLTLIDKKITENRIKLNNGSAVEILAQSEQSVRGNRVQKLRCDEVELFTPEVWQAAQFVTRSAQCGEVYVPGCIEVLSTMHRPFGLMKKLTEETAVRRLFRWNVVNVLENCPENRNCNNCSILPECQTAAKHTNGFFRITDAIQQKARTSSEAWQAEMICNKPCRSDCVYPEFDPDLHVVPFNPDTLNNNTPDKKKVIVVGGMDFGFRSPTVMLWGVINPKGVLHIIDEHVASEKTIEQHILEIKSRNWPHVAWLGIDPAGYQRHEHLGLSTAVLLKQAGFKITARRMDLRSSLEAVRVRLKSADNRIRLFIDPKCNTLIESLQAYHFPPDKPFATEPVKDGTDHACDALRYMVINLDNNTMSLKIKSYL